MIESKWIFLSAPSIEGTAVESFEAMAERIKNEFFKRVSEEELEVKPAKQFFFEDGKLIKIDGCALKLWGYDAMDLLSKTERLAEICNQPLDVMIDQNNYIQEEPDPRTYYQHTIYGMNTPLKVAAVAWMDLLKKNESGGMLTSLTSNLVETSQGLLLFGNFPDDDEDISDMIYEMVLQTAPSYELKLNFELLCNNRISELPLSNRYLGAECQEIVDPLPDEFENSADDLLSKLLNPKHYLPF